MSTEIYKFLKIVYSCKSCRKKFTRRLKVGTKKDFKPSELTFEVLRYPKGVKVCEKCKASDFEISYSFYHEEKIISNGN